MNTAAVVGLAAVDWIGNWPGARWLQQSGTAYLLVNAAHILGLGLLLGAMLPLDLRLVLGRAQPALSVLAPVAIRTAAAGLVLALLTGAWLFSVNPGDYLENAAFRWKLLLLSLALLNVAVQHRQWRSLGLPEAMGALPVRVRVLAGMSALLWISTLLAGRWIGFV
ncbi:hypothetical protein [Pseudoxanthomonas sacheonensis]|uniref:hypothetical protein n=1 Tax=Pseudoxanthomonas sacheonensis TaxID=443615 RepID=UPI001BACAED5|nr:hypothetical protein [Pseudoxanthomonas sacheonensis]